VQDRPTAIELLDAVREFLERDVMAATEGRVQFHTRVAVNALGMVSRELALGTEFDRDEAVLLAGLLGIDDPTVDRRALEVELAARIRAGALDDRRDEVVALLSTIVRHKLEIANPKYLDQ